MKTRVVLDTNVYISAILFGGRPGEVFLLAKEGEYELFVSTALIAELASTLTVKFRWPVDRVTEVVREIGEVATVVRPKKKMSVIERDEDDNRVIECAVLTKANFIVSGDRKHLLSMKQYGCIQIVSVTHFLKKLRKP
ncbi:MAG: putative toxin-antitoxin system toxin component, PIN family [Thermoleophilia bacterium]